jgi:hypothetical protein
MVIMATSCSPPYNHRPYRHHDRRRYRDRGHEIGRKLDPAHASHHARSGAPLCLNCDIAFVGPEQPGAFVIAVPFAKRTCSLVTGICKHCLAREDPATIAFRGWRKIWPDLPR